MTIRKKIRVLYALVSQEWHQQTCGECKASWWAIGPAHPELIRICDACEMRILDRMWELADREYQRQMRGARS